jgi:hypothetical protein
MCHPGALAHMANKPNRRLLHVQKRRDALTDMHSMIRVIGTRFFLLREVLRYLASELIAGRTGTHGLRFEEYLENSVPAGKYRPSELRTALRFILQAALRGSNEGCIDIVVRCHPSELPLQALTDQMLRRLLQYSITHSEAAYGVVMQRVDAEIRRRQDPPAAQAR